MFSKKFSPFDSVVLLVFLLEFCTAGKINSCADILQLQGVFMTHKKNCEQSLNITQRASKAGCVTKCIGAKYSFFEADYSYKGPERFMEQNMGPTFLSLMKEKNFNCFDSLKNHKFDSKEESCKSYNDFTGVLFCLGNWANEICKDQFAVHNVAPRVGNQPSVSPTVGAHSTKRSRSTRHPNASRRSKRTKRPTSTPISVPI